jgi:hypothetical protein
MRVIYTSKAMSKSLGCALYIRCALSIEKYGTVKLKKNLYWFYNQNTYRHFEIKVKKFFSETLISTHNTKAFLNTAGLNLYLL